MVPYTEFRKLSAAGCQEEEGAEERQVCLHKR